MPRKSFPQRAPAGRSTTGARHSQRKPLRQSSRGAAEVVGGIMLFGLVMVAIMTIQVLAVPEWNAEEEFLHSARVQDDLITLDERAVYAATSGSSQRVNVETTVSYPARYVFLSPGPVTGSMAAATSSDITLENVLALDGSSEYLNGSVKVYGSESLSYTPTYTYLTDDGTTIYEGSVLYTVHETGYEQVLRQNLISGNQVHIMVVEADVHSMTTETPVDIVPLSVATKAAPVTGVAGNPINITLPTQLSEAAWERVLEDEMATNGGYVLDITYTDPAPGSDIGFVTITLDPAVTYDLRISKVGFNTPHETQVPAYLAVVEGENGHIPESASSVVVVEARDAFNNPVPGAPVTVSNNGTTPLGGTVDVQGVTGATTVRTDADGRATFVYTAPDTILYGVVEKDTLSFEVHDVLQTVTYDTTSFELEVWDTAGRAADFIISDGRVILTEEATGFVTILGSAIVSGGDDVPVYADVLFDGVVTDPWSMDLNDGNNPRSFYFAAKPRGTEITVVAEATQGIGRAVESTEDSDQVIVLRDGDPVPDYKGLDDQADVEEYLRDYVDYTTDPDNPRMKLAENQAIFLFELGVTNQNSAGFDMQDLVVLVTLQTS